MEPNQAEQVRMKANLYQDCTRGAKLSLSFVITAKGHTWRRV